MGRLWLITGQAGTGKTTKMIQKAVEWAPKLIQHEHQRILAITRMHGSRRRLLSKFDTLGKKIPRTVSTIDSLAFNMLNRWRTSLGYQRVIVGSPKDEDFRETAVGILAGFDRIIDKAVQLVTIPVVGRILGEAYPLVLIDEFQDCHGIRLDFVKGLAQWTNLLLAADDFQLLERDPSGCPAIEWIDSLRSDPSVKRKNLDICYRTGKSDLLEAATHIRDNRACTDKTVPVYCCPANSNPNIAKRVASQIVYGVIICRNSWEGTTALICPSHDPLVDLTIDACNSLLQERKYYPITWYRECGYKDALKQVLDKVRSSHRDAANMECRSEVDGLVQQVKERTIRFIRLRGLEEVPTGLEEHFAEKVVHDQKAYAPCVRKWIVTTVHGAKNQEFDNVIVLWSRRVRKDVDQQRRLLYNAITRAKKNCMVLVPFDEAKAKDDPVIRLLGPPVSLPGNKTSHKKDVQGPGNP